MGKFKHGKTHTRAFRIWSHMKGRCLNKNDFKYPIYGGRGIKICKRWLNFKNFLKDMGEPPIEKQIERINNNKGYFPKNCKWATLVEQANNKRNVKLIKFMGKSQSLKRWCIELDLRYKAIHKRIKNRKWSIEKALTTPLKNNGYLK